MTIQDQLEIPPLLASNDLIVGREPFLSVAIPQYNRRKYVEIALQSVIDQDYDDYEIFVSDDKSADDSNEVLPVLLQESGCDFRYYAHSKNQGYDKNVRFCLHMARGKYVLMLGNDDALVAPDTLRQLAERLKQLDLPDIAVTNFVEYGTERLTKRVFETRILGSGPDTAAHFFRSFSFTSGLVFSRQMATTYETTRWDSSIYYQIFLACRILGAGGRLGAVDLPVVRDHIRIDGDLIPTTYRVRYKDAPLSFRAKHTGLDSVARVAIDAISPFVPPEKYSRLVRQIYSQLLTITYPFWLFEYRQLANWGMAFGIARDLWPQHQLREYSIKWRDRVYLWVIYLMVTFVGLTVPASVFNFVRAPLASGVRRFRQFIH